MSLELEIQQLLIETPDTDHVADALVRKWTSGMVSEDELSTIASFLHHCGYYPTIIDLCLNNLNRQLPIPWRFFSEALKVIVEDIDYATVDSLHQEADSQGHLEELAISRTLHVLEPGLKSIRKEFFDRKWKDYLFQKTLIDEQLQFLQSQRMLEQEKDLLVRYERLFPDDPEVRAAKESFQDRWASEIVQKHSEQQAQLYIQPDDSVEEAREVINEAMLSAARENPDVAYDLAVGLAFIESYQQALDALEFVEDSFCKTWLRLELLLPARRFIDALNEVSLMEMKFADNPETTFAATYYRAQALFGAGQKGSAIELMKSLVALRPNYRAASSKLATWSGTGL